MILANVRGVNEEKKSRSVTRPDGKDKPDLLVTNGKDYNTNAAICKSRFTRYNANNSGRSAAW